MGSVVGASSAKASAVGVFGAFNAEASAPQMSGQLIQGASAVAGGYVDGSSLAKAKVDVGGAAQLASTSATALALETVGPSVASADAILSENPTIAATFGASPVFFAVGELGGAYSSGGTAPETVTSTFSVTIDSTKLSPKGDLLAGFFDPIVIGSGV